MKGKRGLYGPVVNILLILGVIVAVYLLLVGGMSRLAPILGKLGLIDVSEAGEQDQLAAEREIPREDKERLEQAIASMRDSIEICKNYQSSQKCTCGLTLPLFPEGYIIRMMDTQEGSFIAGYKAEWHNDEDIPRSEQVMPTLLPVQPCFSSTLAALATNSEGIQANPQQAVTSLQAIYEPFFNLARQELPENPQVYAVVPERFADKTGGTCFWFDGGSPFSSTGYNGADDMEYRVIGERVENQESFKLLRVDSGHICFITDRERDVDDCHADSTFDEDYFHVAAALPACEPTQQLTCEAVDCNTLDYNQDVCENNACCRWIPGGQRQCFSKQPLDCGMIDCTQIAAQYCEENECCRMATTEEKAQWTAGAPPDCIAKS